MKKKISDSVFSNNIRRNILKLSHKANSSHVGSSLSIVDMLTVIYNQIIEGKSKIELKKNKYQIILSK